MAITSEQLWDIASVETVPTPGVRLVFGRAVRAMATGFFDDGDPLCSVGSTIARILGVIVVLSGITLITIGVLVALGVWAINAILG